MTILLDPVNNNGDFEHGDFSHWTGLNSPTIVTNPVHHGNYAASLDGSTESFYQDFAASATAYARVLARVHALPASGSWMHLYTLRHLTGGGLDLLYVRVANVGGVLKWRLMVYKSNATWETVDAVDANIAIDTWFYIEACFIQNTTGGGKLYINGSLVATMTGTANDKSVERLNVSASNIPSGGVNYFDCIEVADAGPIGVESEGPTAKSFAEAAGGSDVFGTPFRAMGFSDLGHGVEAFLALVQKAFSDAGFGADAFLIPFRELRFSDSGHGLDGFLVLLWKSFGDSVVAADAFSQEVLAIVSKTFSDSSVMTEVFGRKNIIVVVLPSIIGMTDDGKLVFALKRKVEADAS